MRLRTLLPALVLAAAAALARGESNDLDSITLGSMAERADVVAVAEAVSQIAARDGSTVWTFRVTESLRAVGGLRAAGLLIEGRVRDDERGAASPADGLWVRRYLAISARSRVARGVLSSDRRG